MSLTRTAILTSFIICLSVGSFAQHPQFIFEQRPQGPSEDTEWIKTTGDLLFALANDRYLIEQDLVTYGGFYPIPKIEYANFMVPPRTITACRISSEGEHIIYIAVPREAPTSGHNTDIDVLRGMFSELDDIDEIELYWESIDYKKKKEEDKIYTIVEVMPQFPGGDEALKRYLAENLTYPQVAGDNGTSGVVYVTFVVEKDGSVTGAEILRGIGSGCDEEALRVISRMPNWTPGKHQGKPVRIQYNLPVRFAR
ncbi:MAG: energy transducer TonB [Flavobacteriales bacterium]|nr:energy transducer TonB [Flavobacteriales bacterium]